MKIAISLFVLIVLLGTSTREQVPMQESTPILIKSEPLVIKKGLIKSSDSLMIALKNLEYRVSVCSRSVNELLKNKKDSSYLAANKKQ